MTQMMTRLESLENPTAEQAFAVDKLCPDRRNQIRAAAAFSFRDLVHIEVYRASSDEQPGLHHDWKHAQTLPGIVVGVHLSQAPEEYAGLVPVLADEPYPTAGHYVNIGPRLLDPVHPQIERMPQGTDWLMYVLRHGHPVNIP